MTSPRRVLNVAVVGCGEVAQAVHLPNLSVHSESFKVTALCDVSKQSLELCSKRFHVPNTFTSIEEMLASSLPIDLVFILTVDQYHAEHAILCANAGKHVLLEKPMCQTLAEADAIEAARIKNKVVIFIAYMRRYATALAEMKKALEGKTIKYVRVRDIIGNNRYFTKETGMHQQYFTDHPASGAQEISKRKDANFLENFGNKIKNHPRNMQSFAVLGGLGSHDLSAMRDVIGMPEKCISSTRTNDGDAALFWQATLKYPGYYCTFEMAIDDVPLFDCHIEGYTKDSRIKIQYDSPYIKGLPIYLIIQTKLPNGQYSENTIRPTYTDPYVLEYEELYAAVVDGKPYKTTPADAKNDVMLARMIMEALDE